MRVAADPEKDWHGREFGGDAKSNRQRQREIIEKSDHGTAEEPGHSITGGKQAEGRRPAFA